jgi:hypothetical protein
MIKAIETLYLGCRFRSRLEARWAVFFEAMNVKWYYEHEGYALSSGWYLPDFWLPGLELHVEIKPDGVCKHAKSFRDNVGGIVVTNGLPDEGMTLYCWDMGDSSAGTSDRECLWTDTDGLKLCCNTSRSLYLQDFCSEGAGAADIPREQKVTHRLRAAFLAAKGARFDGR